MQISITYLVWLPIFPWEFHFYTGTFNKTPNQLLNTVISNDLCEHNNEVLRNTWTGNIIKNTEGYSSHRSTIQSYFHQTRSLLLLCRTENCKHSVKWYSLKKNTGPCTTWGGDFRDHGCWCIHRALLQSMVWECNLMKPLKLLPSSTWIMLL